MPDYACIPDSCETFENQYGVDMDTFIQESRQFAQDIFARRNLRVSLNSSTCKGGQVLTSLPTQVKRWRGGEGKQGEGANKKQNLHTVVRKTKIA